MQYAIESDLEEGARSGRETREPINPNSMREIIDDLREKSISFRIAEKCAIDLVNLFAQ